MTQVHHVDVPQPPQDANNKADLLKQKIISRPGLSFCRLPPRRACLAAPTTKASPIALLSRAALRRVATILALAR